MDSKITKNSVLIELTSDEALVLLDWVARFNESAKEGSFNDQAEERVLWDIEACLEAVLSDTLSSNYKAILAKARDQIRDAG